MDERKTVGKKLQEIRKRNSFTRDEIAEILEVSKFTYRNWEYDGGEPSSEWLVKLSNAFGVSVDEIVDNKANAEIINRALEVRKRKMRKK